MAMRGVELVQPYLQAAKDVIGRETGSDVTVGRVTLKKPPASTDEISTLIGVTGEIQGVVMIAMSRQTALNIVSHITGESYTDFDELAQSAVAEMANVISGLGRHRPGGPSAARPPSARLLCWSAARAAASPPSTSPSMPCRWRPAAGSSSCRSPSRTPSRVVHLGNKGIPPPL